MKTKQADGKSSIEYKMNELKFSIKYMIIIIINNIQYFMKNKHLFLRKWCFVRLLESRD
jgi:hypothetical protein